MALHVTELTSIGLVKEGDNPSAEVMFFKTKDASAGSAEQTQGDEMSDLDITALPDEAQTHIADLQKSADDATAQIEALEAKVADLTPVEDPAEVEIGKASDQVQALIKSLREDREADREELAIEKRARRDTEFVAKVREDGLEGLLGDAKEIGPVLRALDDADSEAFGKLYQPLLAATQRVELAKAFAEIGASEGDNDPTAVKAEWISKQKAEGSELSASELEVAYYEANPAAIAKERE